MWNPRPCLSVVTHHDKALTNICRSLVPYVPRSYEMKQDEVDARVIQAQYVRSTVFIQRFDEIPTNFLGYLKRARERILVENHSIVVHVQIGRVHLLLSTSPYGEVFGNLLLHSVNLTWVLPLQVVWFGSMSKRDTCNAQIMFRSMEVIPPHRNNPDHTGQAAGSESNPMS